MRILRYAILLSLTICFAGCKEVEGPTGPQGPAGQQGPAGSAGAQGPKGDPGNANVISSTWTVDRNTLTKHVTGASIQIPAEFVKEPAAFTGLFMAYLTPLDALFTSFEAGVTFSMPHAYRDGQTTGSAYVYRTQFGTYYLRFQPQNGEGSPSNYSFLDAGRFAVRLVWAPAGASARTRDHADQENAIQFINGQPVQ